MQLQLRGQRRDGNAGLGDGGKLPIHPRLDVEPQRPRVERPRVDGDAPCIAVDRQRPSVRGHDHRQRIEAGQGGELDRERAAIRRRFRDVRREQPLVADVERGAGGDAGVVRTGPHRQLVLAQRKRRNAHAQRAHGRVGLRAEARNRRLETGVGQGGPELAPGRRRKFAQVAAVIVAPQRHDVHGRTGLADKGETPVPVRGRGPTEVPAVGEQHNRLRPGRRLLKQRRSGGYATVERAGRGGGEPGHGGTRSQSIGGQRLHDRDVIAEGEHGDLVPGCELIDHGRGGSLRSLEPAARHAGARLDGDHDRERRRALGGQHLEVALHAVYEGDPLLRVGGLPAGIHDGDGDDPARVVLDGDDLNLRPGLRPGDAGGQNRRHEQSEQSTGDKPERAPRARNGMCIGPSALPARGPHPNRASVSGSHGDCHSPGLRTGRARPVGRGKKKGEP